MPFHCPLPTPPAFLYTLTKMISPDDVPSHDEATHKVVMDLWVANSPGIHAGDAAELIFDYGADPNDVLTLSCQAGKVGTASGQSPPVCTGPPCTCACCSCVHLSCSCLGRHH